MAMNSNQVKQVIAVIVVGLILTLVALLSVSSNTPKPWAPLPILSNLMLIGAPFFVSALFWLWNLQLFKGIGVIPKRSIVLYLAIAGLSLWHNLYGISYGLEYQGLKYTIIVTFVNIAMILLIATLLIIGLRRNKFVYSLMFHGTLFAWFASYSFPYLGELI